MHPQAEQWLREQAQSLGWSKATKLEGRTTKQGLVGVLVQRNIGAMVEVNCETDFVARNEHFQAFVQTVTRACAQHADQLPTNDALSALDFDADYLRRIVPADGDGSTLSDQLALIIGKVGENASLRRATCFKVTNSVRLAAFAHPAPRLPESADGASVQLGKFGALVALHESAGADTSSADLAEVRRNLCQHIVGMNPAKVGSSAVDKPAEQKDDEQCLIWQEYLLEPSMTVQELLEENQLEVVEFKRFECGEALAEATTEALTQAQAA